MMRLTLLDNLCFGSRDHASRERVERILVRMGRQDLVQYFDDPVEIWFNQMNATALAALHVARAFVLNPEVLVLHCPSKHFDPEYTARLLTLLREFVDQRGLEFDEPVRDRRPRTCFMSTYRMRNVDKADRVLFLDSGLIQSGTKHQYHYLMEREAAPTD